MRPGATAKIESASFKSATKRAGPQWQTSASRGTSTSSKTARAADLIVVTDAWGRVGQSFDREVFAELPVDEVGADQLLLPIVRRFDLIAQTARCSPPCPAKSP
jgi:hypothetical protein